MLSLEKVSKKILEGIMIGHCIVQHTSKIVGYIGNSFYKNCFDKKEEKSIDLYLALQYNIKCSPFYHFPKNYTLSNE